MSSNPLILSIPNAPHIITAVFRLMSHIDLLVDDVVIQVGIMGSTSQHFSGWSGDESLSEPIHLAKARKH